MTIIVLGGLRHDPRIFTDDAPKPLQALLGPMSPETRRRRAWWATLMLVAVVGLSARLMMEMPNTADLWDRLLAAYVMFEVFNLYDAIVLDIGVILLWAPDWAFVPGTKNHPSLRDWKFHVRAFLTGVIIGMPFAGIVVAIWAALRVM
jgi:hypothetical protein